jgi:hypothetical protein
MIPELRKKKIIEMFNVCQGMNIFDCIEAISLTLVQVLNGLDDDRDKINFARLAGDYIIEQTKKVIEGEKKNEPR